MSSTEQLEASLDRLAGPEVDPRPALGRVLRRHRRRVRLRRAGIGVAAVALVLGAAITIVGRDVPARVDVVDGPIPTDDAPTEGRSPRWQANSGPGALLEVVRGDGSLTLAGSDVVLLESGGAREPGVIALDANTGDLLWRYDLDHLSPATVVDADESVALVASRAGSWIAAVDLAAGTERWRVEVGEGETVGEGGLVDGTLYVVTTLPYEAHESAAVAYAVDLAGGDQLWRTLFERGSAPQWAPPVVTDDLVIWPVAGQIWAGGLEQAHALDRRTGEPVWSTDLRGAREAFVGWPALVSGETVVVWSSAGVVGLSQSDGAERWRTALNGMLLAVEGSGVWVTAGSDAVLLDAANGAELDRVAGGQIVVAGNGPTVIAGRSWIQVGSDGTRVDLDLGQPLSDAGLKQPARAGDVTAVGFEEGLVLVHHQRGELEILTPSIGYGDADRFVITSTDVVTLRADGSIEAYPIHP